MTKPLLAIVAFVFHVGFNSPAARADFMNGNILAGLCAAVDEWESGGCVGYIVGAVVGGQSRVRAF